MTAERRYQDGFRRMLVDMHIPDWDPRFLSEYDPVAMADRYEAARLTSVMLYCKSHTGLCNWPTTVGRQHANLGGRDAVGALVEELDRRGIGTCAYYSVVYDNWAAEQHHEWEHVPVQSLVGKPHHFLSPRYGTCCPNNPDYVAYELALIEELLDRHRFDSMFFDMTFWPAICVCEHCRGKFREESGAEIPTTVSWTDPAWVGFQAARERWISAFITLLVDTAKAAQPHLFVYNNAAPALTDWVLGQPLSSYGLTDFVGGDLYGDRYEQLLVCKLLLHATNNQPSEFMTSRCVNLADHVTLVSEASMQLKAFAATALSSAFLFIDAIDPIGTVNDGVYERIGRVFEKTAPFEPFLGGEPVEDVAIYVSGESQMDFAHERSELTDAPNPDPDNPHFKAAKGAARALQRAHIPFGVITRRQLAELGRYRVVVLPNVLRMDTTEVVAIRDYVANGGKVYASRYTSLTCTDGSRGDDFALADVFGCHYEGEETGLVVYSHLADEAALAAVAPQQHLIHGVVYRPAGCGIPRLSESTEGVPLATLAVAYAHPLFGDSRDHQWSSIHSVPPWDDLPNPTIVRNGGAVYSVADIEAHPEDAPERLFVHLVRSLLGEPSFAADTHPAVWVNAFAQPGRTVITMLNYQADEPPVAVPATLSLQVPAGCRLTSVTQAPDHVPLHWDEEHGRARIAVPSVDPFAMVVAAYDSL